MTHDRTRITALVDDELSPADRERVLAHVTSCPECRAAYLQERAAKQALAARDSDTKPDRAGDGPSAALMSSLLSMAEPGEPLALGRGDTAAQPPTRPRTLPDQRSRRARRAAKGLGLSLLGVAGLCGLAFALGGPAENTTVRPPVSQYAQEHARTAAQLPFGDAAADVLRTSAGAGP